MVAVSNRVAKALETSEFQQLLGALGLQPPSQQVLKFGQVAHFSISPLDL